MDRLRAYVGLGANLGQRRETIYLALGELAATEGVQEGRVVYKRGRGFRPSENALEPLAELDPALEIPGHGTARSGP